MQVAAIRALLPVTERYAYFQTSGFAPKPLPVIEEVVRYTRFINEGPALPHVHKTMMETVEATRAKVAATLNAHPDTILLGENATIGINLVAHGINWQQGDNVLLSTHEHPGNRIPWYNLARRHGVTLRFLQITNDPKQMLAELPQLVDARTRVISLSHVSRRTGVRLPAREIVAAAHERGVPVLLDGAQSYGAIPVDVTALDCDFYAFSGHKYIMGPQGTGGCYIRRDRIEWLQPSWLGSRSQKEFDLQGGLTLLESAKRFEFGTRNWADQAGFGKALDILQEIGWEQIFAYIAAYTDRLKSALLRVPTLRLETPLPYAQSSGIVTFALPGHTSAELCATLLEQDHILLSPLEHDTSLVRVSTHIFNTDEEIERLVQALERILR